MLSAMPQLEADTTPAPTQIYAPHMLSGKTALVTGGGTGIGRAVALQLASCGARVAVLGRRPEPLEAVVQEIDAATGSPGNALAHPADIRDEEQVAQAIAAIRDKLGRITILVNNAGGQFVAPARDTATKGLRAVGRLNLDATWEVTRQVATDSMIEQGGGRIVNVTLAMERGIPGMMAGVATRAAVHSLTRTVATEWARHGISIVSVAAGHVLTDGLRGYPPEVVERLQQTIPAGRFGTPEEIAATIAFLVSPLGGYVTGTTLTIDGGKSNAGDTYMIDRDAT